MGYLHNGLCWMYFLGDFLYKIDQQLFDKIKQNK